MSIFDEVHNNTLSQIHFVLNNFFYINTPKNPQIFSGWDER
jgi:hypothetical protein